MILKMSKQYRCHSGHAIRVSPEWHGIKAIFVDFLRRKAG
jgi:hypothetical protein